MPTTSLGYAFFLVSLPRQPCYSSYWYTLNTVQSFLVTSIAHSAPRAVWKYLLGTPAFCIAYYRWRLTTALMDSMRSLNTSLPRSPKRSQPPEQLLQAFKTAALSVTNLYKTAAADQARARTEGYQEALGEILQFLDKEELGLRDGEGWRVRRWATERLDARSPPLSTGNDSDDDRREGRRQARSSSPVMQRSEVLQAGRTSTPPSPVRSVLPSSHTSAPVQQLNATTTRPDIFTFASPHPYPQDIDMPPPETASSNNSQSESHPPPSSSTSAPTVRVEVVPRGSRTPHRNGTHPSRHSNRNTNPTRSLGTGAGTKRRIQLGDYFDIGNLGDGRDGSDRGSKRGRFG